MAVLHYSLLRVGKCSLSPMNELCPARSCVFCCEFMNELCLCFAWAAFLLHL
ncbi:hypothetical protein HanRHA438_Chr11g0503021 [Helianthus annuus]|nr:hypothetical protein HanRHA438_Chr11g0503021 [Helianthus annuus]